MVSKFLRNPGYIPGKDPQVKKVQPKVMTSIHRVSWLSMEIVAVVS